MAISASPVRPSGNESESVFVTAYDGLRLHVQSWGSRRAPSLPVICLPGLSRTAADFDALARNLSRNPDRPRRVLALDYRGRGQSDFDRNPANYNLVTELNDIMAAATALAAMPAVFVGTSRGGILTMLLAAARPTMIAGAILNDIGPVIEPKGLIRIKGYVGKLPEPKTLGEGAEILRRLFNSQFPKLTGEDWLAAARRGWRERGGRLEPTYDVALARTLDNVDPERPLPPLWNEFDALAGVPLMVVRGANSDILSAKTVAALKERRKDLETIEVADQGHTPLLIEPDVIGRIADFVDRCEGAHGSH